MIKKLKSCSSFALTSDIWTSVAMIGYLGITCHTLSEDFTSMDFLLQVKELPGNHTGDHIGEALNLCMEEFELIDKPHILVTDNASNMKVSAKTANAIHIGCAAHLVNLIVREALEEPSIKNAIEQVKAVSNVINILTFARLYLMFINLLWPHPGSIQFKLT